MRRTLSRNDQHYRWSTYRHKIGSPNMLCGARILCAVELYLKESKTCLAQKWSYFF